jgi:hypothetical protein
VGFGTQSNRRPTPRIPLIDAEKEGNKREREGAVILPGLVGFPRARISALFSEERDSRGKEEEEEE